MTQNWKYFGNRLGTKTCVARPPGASNGSVKVAVERDHVGFAKVWLYDVDGGGGGRGGDGMQIFLLCGRRVRFLSVAGLCQNFTFSVAHFQTTSLSTVLVCGATPTNRIEGKFQYIPSTAKNLTLLL